MEKNNKIIASRKFQKELLSHSKEKGKSLKPKIVPANFPTNFCRVGLKLSSGVLGATSAICLVGFATATDVPDKLKSKHHATFGGPASPGFATCKAPNSWPVTQLIWIIHKLTTAERIPCEKWLIFCDKHYFWFFFAKLYQLIADRALLDGLGVPLAQVSACQWLLRGPLEFSALQIYFKLGQDRLWLSPQ